MRKLLYAVGIATVLLFTTTVKASGDAYYTNLNGIDMTEHEYNNLVELGFTEVQIAKMAEEEFLNNKDIEAELLTSETRYTVITTRIVNGIKQRTYNTMTEEEYAAYQLQSQQVQSLNPGYSPNISGNYYDGYVYNSVFENSTSISYVDGNYLRYKTNIEWEDIPDTDERFWDIIGIGIEADKVHIGGSIEFREDWTKSNGVEGYDLVCAPKTQATGGSVMYELPSGSLSELRAYTYFDVYKNQGVGTITGLSAAGNVSHASHYYDPDVPGGVYYNYDVTTIGITVYPPYATYYSTISPAYASFVGTW